MAEGLDLGVEGGADAADLALRQRRDAEGLHEVLHPARADAQHIRLLDHREEGPLGAPARFQEGGEVAAVTDPGDGEIDGAHAGIPAPLAIAVARGEAPLRRPLALGPPVSSLTSASMTAWARTRTPSRRRSTSPSAIALRTVSSTAILSSAIVVSLVSSVHTPTTRG